jgi:hypothetical protein
MIEYARCIYICWQGQYSELSLEELLGKQPEFLAIANRTLKYTAEELHSRLQQTSWYFK